MLRKTAMLTLIVLVGIAGGCAKQGEVSDPAEEAFDALKAAWSDVETAEAKVALAEDFLARYPDTKHSGSMAGAIVYYRGHEMEDPQGAWNVVSVALDKIQDPEQRFEVSMEALDLADSVDVPLDIAEVADALGAVRPLTYSEHEQVAEAAIELENWMVADEHSLAAMEMATPEQYRSDYPDRDFTDEEIATRVQYRLASSLTNDGWAVFNLGDPELAMTRFAEAEAAGSVTYLGVPNTPLYLYWGRAALSEGDPDRAIELLGMETVFGENGSTAEPYLREAYVAKNGSDDGFDEFLWSTRKGLAKNADDFELLDYDGNPRSLSEANGKVTLLAFWFPT
jgi:tetratricopeptide (TPR) repeat protein